MKVETQTIIAELKNEKKSKKKNKGEWDENSLNKDIDLEKTIQDVNLKIITNIENQKQDLRDKLVNAIKHIIWFQLICFNLMVFTIVLSVTSNIPLFKDIDTELSIQLFEFLKYYISATIVELLGMLVFILHYVFSDFRFMKPFKSKIREKFKLNRPEDKT